MNISLHLCRFRLNPWPIFSIVLAASPAVAQPFVEPEPPRVFLQTRFVAPGGKTTLLKAGDDLQAALNAAQPGDTLALQAGATWRGNFVLPAKANPQNRWIVLRTANLGGIPGEGVRLDPRRHGAALPRIVSASALPALSAASGAHHYRMIGIEFGIAPDVTMSYDIVRFGEGTEKSAEETPHDMIVDRCYVHGNPLAHAKRGVLLNGRATSVIDSHVSEIHGLGQDTQAIAGFNGLGPFKIQNNYLEGAAENVMFGGSTPSTPGLVPSDIEIRGNHFSRPTFWREGILPTPEKVSAQAAAGGALAAGAPLYYRVVAVGRAGYNNETEVSSPASPEVSVALANGQRSTRLKWAGPDYVRQYRVYRTSDAPDSGQRRWSFYLANGTQFTDTGAPGATEGSPFVAGPLWAVKNLFELKSARRVLFDGNILEHHWPHAQSGPAILFTVRTEDGQAPQAVIEDVLFSNNILRHASAGFNILGQDSAPQAPGQTQRIAIRNNLLHDIGGPWGGSGGLLLMGDAARHILFEHNTILQRGTMAQIAGRPSTGFVFRNNLVRNGEYGFKGDGVGTGLSAIETFFVDPAQNVLFSGNAIIGGEARWYPEGNLFPGEEAVGFVDAEKANFRLSADSPLKGKAIDASGRPAKRDIGADIDAIEKATRGAVSGVWTAQKK